MASARSFRCLSAAVLLAAGSCPIAGSAGNVVTTTLQPPRFEISNGAVRVWYQANQGTWGTAAGDGSAELSGCGLGVRLGDKQIRSTESCRRSARREEGHDEQGDYVRLTVIHAGLPHLPELIWSATLRPKMPYAVVHASARIAGDAPGLLQAFDLISSSPKAALRFGTAPAGWMCFRDSGGQGGTAVMPFFAGERARISSPATLVVHDGRAGKSLLAGWLSWKHSNPNVLLGGKKTEGVGEASAGCAYYLGNAVAEAATEPLMISFQPDPLAALEEYAQEVRVVNKPPLRKDNMLGWLSWYCSRLKVTEQFVLENAQVIANRFRDYGVDTMQVDHGWEYRDVVGNWIANQRFPHGMKWLGQELEKQRMKLGIWMAVSRVSEFAPFYSEHPEAMIHKADGSPWAFIERWSWAPYGKVFNLDPTHPLAQQHYRRSLEGLMDAGCRYYKVDFIGSTGVIQGVFHDPKRPRGYPMVRYEMQQIRDAVGPDSWLRYCSSPTNVYCGIVNIGGATMDIGNARGNWDHLGKYHQQLGTCWYKHRTFWHNEPDALIVGEGQENEARMRCAWLVFSGGVVALGDDLPRIAPERMALIPKCLPAYDVAARPLDLFEQVPARLWDLNVRKPWGDYHVVGVFNLDTNEARIKIPLKRLGMEPSQAIAWEFWTQSPLGSRGEELAVTVPARDSRIVAIRKASGQPQVVATDMHLTMGGVELSDVKWDAASSTLSGRAKRAKGEKGQVFIHVPPAWELAGGGERKAERIAAVPLRFDDSELAWSVRFREAKASH